MNNLKIRVNLVSIILPFFSLIFITPCKSQNSSIDLELLKGAWELPCEQPINDTRYMECSIMDGVVNFSIDSSFVEGVYTENYEFDGLKHNFEILKLDEGYYLSIKGNYKKGIIITLTKEKLVIQNSERGVNFIFKRKKED
ncbi:MAG: hypothetical protein ACI9LN_003851 [Saprospiraceae bacterium]|jgi:hypothetical protein